MSDEQQPTKNSGSSPPDTATPGQMNRRGFFRGAAALTVGSIAAPAVADQAPAPNQPVAGAPRADADRALAEQTSRSLRWAGNAPADWVRPRAGVDYNVVIVGGGQSGLAIAHGLKRKGVGRVDVIDQSDPGQAGIWRTIARMHQLRTPKTLGPGPEGGNPSLSFRAWYETLNGPDSFDKLDRIPRLAWADYLAWFQQATNTTVRSRTRLIEIEPQGDVLRLHLDVNGARRVETTRKLVLANGYAGAGGPNVPDFIRALPSAVWTHTAGRVPFETFKGKVVGVIGAGSSAFDAAAVALEAGASEVHLFSRRAFIDYQGQPPRPAGSPPPAPATPADRGHANFAELTYELPDVVRWRNFVAGDRRVASVPLDSLSRAVAFPGFRIHLNTSVADVAMAGNGQVSARAGQAMMRFDHLIAATGYRIDLANQPEFARIHEHIALWRDRFQPAPGDENTAGSYHPYLGAGFQFLPRAQAGAEYLRNIHCFNLAAALSFGIPVGDVPSMIDHPRLATAIARDLYVEGVDIAANQRFINLPQVAPDPAPYERTVVGRARDAA